MTDGIILFVTAIITTYFDSSRRHGIRIFVLDTESLLAHSSGVPAFVNTSSPSIAKLFVLIFHLLGGYMQQKGIFELKHYVNKPKNALSTNRMEARGRKEG